MGQKKPIACAEIQVLSDGSKEQQCLEEPCLRL